MAHSSNCKSAGPEGLLVIGYGNELRGDDGVGPHVARAVEAMGWEGVRVMSCHQLTPELAEPIARAKEVIFVDARLSESIPAEERVKVRALESTEDMKLLTHACDPQSLLGLACHAFGRQPRAWWITIPVRSLEFGEPLSAQAKKGAAQALEEISMIANLEV
jgi:hydrogenase maturation protease